MSRNSFAELPEYNSDQESEKAPEKTTEKPTEKKTRKPKVQWAFVEKFETNELAQEFVKKESIWSFKREYETVDSYNKTYRCNFVTQRSKLQCPASFFSNIMQKMKLLQFLFLVQSLENNNLGSQFRQSDY
jgi:hypothetical protein